MTATTQPREVTATEFRGDVARVLRDAHYGHPTLITNNGDPFARVVHPDAGVTPDPDLWQAAHREFDRLKNTADLPLDASRALAALGNLLSSYYGYEETTDAR